MKKYEKKIVKKKEEIESCLSVAKAIMCRSLNVREWEVEVIVTDCSIIASWQEFCVVKGMI